VPEIAFETFEKLDLKDSLILVAFPTTGSASSIAAHYLAKHLELPLVGHVLTPELSGVMAIQDGKATSALRVMGGETKCRLDKACPKVFVVLTELALPPMVTMRIADFLLTWAKTGGAHLVLALEGVVRGEGDDTPDVYCAAAQPDVVKELKKVGIPVMERALIGGVTSHIVLAGPSRGVRTGALLVEATRDHPDGRAAAALIAALAKVMPEVTIDPKPLLKEAMELEAEITQNRQSADASFAAGVPSQFI
jgi:uncharacterized protein